MPSEKEPEKVKVEWPKEILDLLQRAGPLWSFVLGILLMLGGWKVNSQSLEGAGIGFSAVGFLIFVSRRPSRFTRTDVFLDLRNLFIGRDEDRDQLVDAIRRVSILWVSGESGSGKSSLLSRAVAPSLSERREFLPLYIDNWGADWELGPATALTNAFREKAESLGARWTAEGVDTPASLALLLEQSAKILGRTPLLILDQFDDYVVDNIERFRPGGGGLVITAGDLEGQNAFWREVSRLVRAGTIRCIFVVRDEQGWGQSAVSFVPVREFFVARLQTQFLDQILEPPGTTLVENPERGWNKLRERLKKDLYEKGGILPIQMRIVLQRLPDLRPLNEKEYERAGGALGLAAEYLAEAIDRVAAATQTNPPLVREILGLIVNPLDRTKTRDVSVEVLELELNGALAKPALLKVLEQLKSEGIARDRADESGARRWRFDHDYLARAYDELERRENATQRILQGYVERLSVPGLWNKRRAIILPWDICRIVWGKLRRKIVIGNGWPVLLASSAVWLFGLAVIALGVYSTVANGFSTRIDEYVAYFDHGEQFRDIREVKRWADLAQEPLPVRQGVARKLLANMEAAGRLVADADRARLAAAAFGGLSPAAPLLFHIVDCTHSDSRDLSAACIFVSSQFGQNALDILKQLVTNDFRNNPGDNNLTADLLGFAGDEWFHKFCRPVPTNLSALSVPCVIAVFPESSVKPPKTSPAAGTILDGVLSGSLEMDRIVQIDKLRSAVGDSTLNSHYVAPLLKKARIGSQFAADALSVLATFMPADQAIAIGRETLDASRTSGQCLYRADFVRDTDIRTALSALAYPVCAADYGREIQRAIVEATTKKPAGDVDRWTFAREWVKPNAAKYGYDPDRFNGFYACYLQPLLESFNPFRSRRRID